nr:hypothetical protein [Candidatus Sigynarchaeota archaeon]
MLYKWLEAHRPDANGSVLPVPVAHINISDVELVVFDAKGLVLPVLVALADERRVRPEFLMQTDRSYQSPWHELMAKRGIEDPRIPLSPVS